MKIFSILLLMLLLIDTILADKSKIDDAGRKILIFENFESEYSVKKFTSKSENMKIESDKNGRYGKWELKGTSSHRHGIKATFQIPDLHKFTGIIFSIKKSNFNLLDFELLLIEDKKGPRHEKAVWSVSLYNISDKWKEVKIPFRYFRSFSDNRPVDLTIVRIMNFLAITSEDGYIAIDNIRFYRK